MLTFSISLNASSDVIIVNKGDPAPFVGYLMDKETGQLSRIRLIEGEEAKKLNLSYQKSIENYQANEMLYNSQVKTVLEQNDKLSQSLRSSQSLNSWEKIGYFISGVILSGAAVYGASQLRK